MKKKLTLFSAIILLAGMTKAQDITTFDSDFQQIKQHLVEWDAVRGEWLASSMLAMADRRPTPDRNFPEDFTPAEMFQAMPADRQERVRSLVAASSANADENSRQRWNRINAVTSRTPNCKLVMGRSYGDPHLKSFDGASYSFQTVGEFTLVKSASGHMNIQVRQRPQSDDFSLNTAVAMNVDGDRVAFYANEKPDGNTTTPIRINGEPIYIEGNNYFLEHGGTISRSGSNDYIVTWPSGERVKLDQSRTGNMGFYNVAVEIYPCNDSFDGILGNANGRSSDDFDVNNRFGRTASWNMSVFGSTNRNDQLLEKEYLAFLAKDFARQYRITPEESLFDYGFNQSTYAFTDESFPRVHRTIGDLSSSDYRRAERECQRRGLTGPELSACIYDNGFLRIPPTPQPTIPNRNVGRTLEPVRNPAPNRNPGQKPYDERYRTPANNSGPGRSPQGDNNRSTGTVESSSVIRGEEQPSRENPGRTTPKQVENQSSNGRDEERKVSTETPVRNPNIGGTTTPETKVEDKVRIPVNEPASDPVRPTRNTEPVIKKPVKQVETNTPSRTVPTNTSPTNRSSFPVEKSTPAKNTSSPVERQPISKPSTPVSKPSTSPVGRGR